MLCCAMRHFWNIYFAAIDYNLLFGVAVGKQDTFFNLYCILSTKVIEIMLPNTKVAPHATSGAGTLPKNIIWTAYAKSSSVLRTMFTMIGVAILLAGMSNRLPSMLAMLVPNIKIHS